MHRHAAHHVSGRSAQAVHPRKHDQGSAHDTHLPNGKTATKHADAVLTATVDPPPAAYPHHSAGAAVAGEVVSVYRSVRVCCFERGSDGALLMR